MLLVSLRRNAPTARLGAYARVDTQLAVVMMIEEVVAMMVMVSTAFVRDGGGDGGPPRTWRKRGLAEKVKKKNWRL